MTAMHRRDPARGASKSPARTPPHIATVSLSPPVAVKSEQKWCSGCARALPVDGFARDKSKASGRKSICRACDRAKSRRYYEQNRERKLAYMAERAARLRAAKRRTRKPG